MFNLVANFLLIIGAGILISSQILVRRLMIQLPPGKVRARWFIMAALSATCIAGYLFYAIVFWDQHHDFPDLIVPGVFFFSSCFIWLSGSISLQVIADVKKVSDLERERVTDATSGIYNRRYFDRRLEEEFARVKRYETPLSLLLIDIDHFRKLNDSFGHQTGDQVLASIGRMTQGIIRVSDVAARYGSDEFIVFAHNTPASIATALAERLRAYIARNSFQLASVSGKEQEVRVTVSIGVASYSKKTDDIQSLVQDAYDALHQAKRDGRNCVVSYEETPPQDDPVAGGEPI
jgi:diguanylate cyclase (GGDEF)-like protein